jgi:hypothetical protein
VGNVGRRVGGSAETKDLFVLRGQPCRRLGAKVRELIDRRVRLRKTGFELVDVSPQPFDLCCLRVGGSPVAVQLPKPLLELDAQVCVGPISVESGAVDGPTPRGCGSCSGCVEVDRVPHDVDLVQRRRDVDCGRR